MRNLIKKRYIDRAFGIKGKLFLIFYTLLSLLALYSFTQYWSKYDYTVVHNFSFLLSLPMLYSLFKLISALFYYPSKKQITKNLKVSVVIPNFNESVGSVMKCIDCMLRQTYPVHEIIFVDDGSKDDSAYWHLVKFQKEMEAQERPWKTRLIVHKFEKNQGKKAAQAWGFQNATGDIFMLVDSDGYISHNAVKEMIRNFENDKVTSVCGHINLRNVRHNFLTRMQDIVYEPSFQSGRASQSVFGSVLVCSGALSMHRREVVIDNLDEFLDSKVFGIVNEAGDDRLLTFLSQKSGGKTVYQSTAICRTDGPTSLKTFFKQQVRWNKSALLYCAQSLKVAWRRPMLAAMMILETYLWLICTVSSFGLLMIFGMPLSASTLMMAVQYYIMVTYINKISYVFRSPVHFLLSPLYSLVYGALLLGIRVHALLTIGKFSWGTR